MKPSFPLLFRISLGLGCLPLGPVSRAMSDELLLDYWDQAIRCIVSGAPASTASADLAERQAVHYQNHDVMLRFDDFHVGSFSLELIRPSRVTLLASVWGYTLPLRPDATLEFWLKPSGQDILPDKIATVAKLREREVEIPAERREAKDGWSRYEGLLTGSDAGELEALTLLLADRPMQNVLLDGVCFRSPNGTLGLTDKPVDQWVVEAANTRPKRVSVAVEAAAAEPSREELRPEFDQMWAGGEVRKANAVLREFLGHELESLKRGASQLWSLSLNMRLIQFYHEFGSKSDLRLLEPATEKLLLEVLWERTKAKNEIGWASTNTWWLTGSENHDLNAKVCNLLTARIFMEEPDYRDRLYPNADKAPGHGYWFHLRYTNGYGPDAVAPWKAEEPRNAAAHYQAWVAFFDRYITERAKRGFFVENASPVYMKWTLGFLHMLRAYCGNEALKRKAGDFLDFVWADWAQHQISGLRGGPKTRHHDAVGGYDSMTNMSRFLLGGPGMTNLSFQTMMLDDYVFPPIVVELALDSRGRGRYAITARGVGEEEATRPRPVGMEKTLMVDREARFLKYSWVTPDYILGTQMDHPDAVHSHLSAVGRWHGLIVAGEPAARIVPTGGPHKTKTGEGDADMEVMYLTAQNKNVLIGQQARRWQQVSPLWFPATPMHDKSVVLHVGSAWDEIVEEKGWVFFRKQNAYAAVREVVPRKGETLTKPVVFKPDLPVDGSPNFVQISDGPVAWTEDKAGITLSDNFGVFIIHAGSRSEHESFSNFRATVLASKLNLQKTVVPEYYMVSYQPGEAGAGAIQFPASAPDIPLVAGQPVNYLPEKLSESPFLESTFGSGVVTIKKNARELTLDMNTPLGPGKGRRE
jgi:hypothetical protein